MKAISDWLFRTDDSPHLSSLQRATHTFVIGQPGTGKSRALESWIRQDIAMGHGVGVIDPHGDLFNHLIYHIASKPEVWDRVIILDPCHPKWTFPFNPLEAIEGLPPERLALFMTDIVVKIWGIDSASAPRMVWLLTNSFMALSMLKLTLLDLPRFLLEREYREQLLPRLGHEGVQAFFKYEFPQTQGAVHQWVTPVLNKIGSLIFDQDIRLMLGGKSKVSFRDILDRKLIFLANISKGILGEGSSALLGAFIVAQIQKAALARADTHHREPFYLYLDEFQNYTTDNIVDILSESRKYALSLTLANQFLDQISPRLRSSVLNTSGTMVCFRVGYQDASHMAKEIFPSSDYLTADKSELKLQHSGSLPFLSLEEHKDELGWDGLAKLLTQLPSRCFWYRNRTQRNPVHHRAFRIPDPDMTADCKANVNKLYDAFGVHYGRLKLDARRGLAHDFNNSTQGGGKNAGEEEKDSGSSPFWGI